MVGDIVLQLRDTRYPGQLEMRRAAADEIEHLRAARQREVQMGEYKKGFDVGLCAGTVHSERLEKALSALVDALVIYQNSPVGSIEATHAARDLDDALDGARSAL